MKYIEKLKNIGMFAISCVHSLYWRAMLYMYRPIPPDAFTFPSIVIFAVTVSLFLKLLISWSVTTVTMSPMMYATGLATYRHCWSIRSPIPASTDTQLIAW